MANETLITDLVAQEALDQLAQLDKAMEDTLETYADVAKEMAKGLKINVEVHGDLDKLSTLYEKQMKRASDAAEQYTKQVQQQAQSIANTTNTISRQLQEQEKLNKAQRETYTEQQKGLDVANRTLGTYEQNIAALARINKEMQQLKAAYKQGSIGAEEYLRKEGLGTFKVLSNYFASHQTALTGATTVTATVYTDWATGQEKHQILTMRLDKPKAKHLIGEVNLGNR